MNRTQMHDSSPTPVPISSDLNPLPQAFGDRIGAGPDVVNLFAFFGAAGATLAYQEIHSDKAAQMAAARWPLCAEWLAGNAPVAATDARHGPESHR